MDKEIKIYVPENLSQCNIASALVYIKVMKLEDLEPMEKVIQLIASLNDLDTEDIRKIPIKEIDRVGTAILKVFQEEDEDYNIDEYAVIDIDGIKYGLEPNFDKIETGAYIDITQDIIPKLDENLHRLMAILYRPIINTVKDNGYEISVYSTEDAESVKAREELFLKKMPYSTVRAVVNFTLSLIES